MERWVVKLIALILLSLTNIIFTLLPIKLSAMFTRHGFKGLQIISYMMCFGGGVFLSVFALHMAPDARELLRIVKMPGVVNFDLADMLMILGFLMMLALEKVVQRWYRKSMLKKGDGKVAAEKGNVCYIGQEKNLDDVVQFEDSMTKCLKKIHPKGSCSCLSTMSSISTETDDTTDLEDDRTGSAQISMEHERKPTDTTINQYPGKDHLQNEVSYNGYVSNGVDPEINGHPENKANITGVQKSNIYQNGTQLDEGQLDGHHHHHVHLHGTRSLLLLLALSMHHVFEGISVGLKRDSNTVWTLTIAIISHEVIISLSLGLQLVKSYTKLSKIVIAGTLCSLMTPIGISIGMAIVETGGKESEALDITNGVLQAISTGVFLYVTFFEILQGEITPEDDNLWKVFCVFLGYIAMVLLTFIPEDAEHGIHGDNVTQVATVTYNISHI